MAAVVVVLGLALAAVRRAGTRRRWSAEQVREGGRMAAVAVALPLPWVFERAWPVVALAALVTGVLMALRVSPAVRARLGSWVVSGERPSVGDVSLPVSVCALFLLTAGSPVLYAVPLLLVGLAGPAAARVEARHGLSSFATAEGTKSREGSVVFASVAFLCVHVPLLAFTPVGRVESLWVAAIVAVLATIVEAVSWRGLDVVFVPLGTFAVLLRLLTFPGPLLAGHFAVLLALVSVAAALRRETTVGGAGVFGAALVGYLAWALGGTAWLLPPALVFVLYARIWPAAREADGLPHDPRRRPHTAHNVFSVSSVGVAWLLAAGALGVELLLPYALAWGAALAFLGVERMREGPAALDRRPAGMAGGVASDGGGRRAGPAGRLAPRLGRPRRRRPGCRDAGPGPPGLADAGLARAGPGGDRDGSGRVRPMAARDRPGDDRLRGTGVPRRDRRPALGAGPAGAPRALTGPPYTPDTRPTLRSRLSPPPTPPPVFIRLAGRLRHRRQSRRLAALTPDAARARATRGASLLDDRDAGWADRIDPASLALGDGAACVLGQLWGEYRHGLGRARVIDLSSAPTRFVSPVDLGFQAVSDLGDAAEALDYALLTRAWRGEVAARTGLRGDPTSTPPRNAASARPVAPSHHRETDGVDRRAPGHVGRVPRGRQHGAAGDRGLARDRRTPSGSGPRRTAASRSATSRAGGSSRSGARTRTS